MRRRCRCGLVASPFDGLCIGCWCDARLQPDEKCSRDGCERRIMRGAGACVAHCGHNVFELFRDELIAVRSAYELEWVIAEIERLASAKKLIERLKPYIDETHARVGDVHMSLDGEPISPFEPHHVDPATYRAHDAPYIEIESEVGK